MTHNPYPNWFRSGEEFQAYCSCLQQIKLGDWVQVRYDFLNAWNEQTIVGVLGDHQVIDTRKMIAPLRYGVSSVCIGFHAGINRNLNYAGMRYFDKDGATDKGPDALALRSKYLYYLWIELPSIKITQIRKA